MPKRRLHCRAGEEIEILDFGVRAEPGDVILDILFPARVSKKNAETRAGLVVELRCRARAALDELKDMHAETRDDRLRR